MNTKERKLRKIEDEVWRVVPDCNGRYQVSNYGRVKSFAYDKKAGKVLKCGIVHGFKIVQLSTVKGIRKVYLHKLVAEMWLPRPSEKHTIVTHLDGNLLNNQISNLEWHTKESLLVRHRAFFKEKYANGKNPKVIRNSKLEESDVMLLKSMLERGVVQAKIAKLFRISEMQVTRIKRGENWGHVQARKSK
jgi:hypothetical protein